VDAETRRPEPAGVMQGSESERQGPRIQKKPQNAGTLVFGDGHRGAPRGRKPSFNQRGSKWQ